MNNLDRNGLLFPEVTENMKPTFSRLPVYFENIDRENRRKLINDFVRSGIEVTPYIERSLPYLFNEKSSDHPIAEKMANQTLTIPTHPNMNKRDLDKISNLLNHWPHL